jgi:hypothetical protein
VHTPAARMRSGRAAAAASVVALTFAFVAGLLLVAWSPQSRDSASSATAALLGACSDSTICSRYALLRSTSVSAPAQLTGPARRRGRQRREARDDDVATGGFSLPESLVTAPVVAAAHFVQAEAQSSETQSIGGVPQFHAGQVLHISTSQGKLPLFVDGASDDKGDVPVHGFREGVRYVGYIRVGSKANGISYPPSSMLHAKYKMPRSEHETSVRGHVKLQGEREAVMGKLAIAPDNGVMTTINTRAMATPQGSMAFNPNFVYGVPASPRSSAFAPLRAISNRVQQQRRKVSAALRRRAAARLSGRRRNGGASGSPATDDENEGHTFHGRPYNTAKYDTAAPFDSGDPSGGAGARAPTVQQKRAKELKGYFDVSADHYASVNLSPVACPGAKMSASCGYSEMSCQQARGVHIHLHVEVVCPPYPAVAHGSVWYKGKKLNHTATDGSRHYMAVQSGRTLMKMPLAAEGDVKTCDKVDIKCDAHYELDGREDAYQDPYCLENGEYEQGQACVPIMCDPYDAPENGAVWPSGKVMAGDRVVITCADGYKPFYHEGSRRNPKCLDSREYQRGAAYADEMSSTMWSYPPPAGGGEER